jgi:hypothetical protein
MCGSRDSSVGIATEQGLDGPSSISGMQDFSLLHSVQTSSGTHPASYSLGIRPPGREVDHSPPSGAEVKNSGVILQLPPISSRHKKNKLHGLSPRANYTDRETAASRRSACQLLRIKGETWSA